MIDKFSKICYNTRKFWRFHFQRFENFIGILRRMPATPVSGCPSPRNKVHGYNYGGVWINSWWRSRGVVVNARRVERTVG